MSDGAGGGGAGAGYNIPISVSYARSDTTNPVFGANTEFVFNSPMAGGVSNDQTSRAISAPTATSSAAEGNAAAMANPALASQEGPTGGGVTSALSKVPTWGWIALGAGVFVLAIFYMRRR